MVDKSHTPPAWRLLLAIASVKFGLHLISSGPLSYGYFMDEFYFLDSVNHLAWGYVDYPPFSIALLRLVTATLGDSLLAIRVVPALAGSATVVLAGLMAREVGGGRTAQGLSGLAVLAAPVYLGICGIYSMNAIEQPLWALAAFLVLRLINRPGARLWLLLGVVMGMGLLNKISMLWFGFGLVVGLVLTPQRRSLRTPWPWVAGGIAFLLFSPYILWNVEHGWPTVEFARNALLYKNPPAPPLVFIKEQLWAMHPLIAPFWIAGLAYYFGSPAMRPYRLLGWIWLSVFLLLMASGAARSYYLAPSYTIVLASAGVFVERLASRRNWSWLPLATGAALTLSGVMAAPMSLPLLPPQQYIAYERMLGLSPDRSEIGELPPHFAIRFHGPAVVQAVVKAFEMLSPEEQRHVGIFASRFGETGSINFLGREYGLPRAVGSNNNYWIWGPNGYTGELMLILAREDSELLDQFASAERVADIKCKYCLPGLKKKSVYLCRGLRRPLKEIWPHLKNLR